MNEKQLECDEKLIECICTKVFKKTTNFCPWICFAMLWMSFFEKTFVSSKTFIKSFASDMFGTCKIAVKADKSSKSSKTCLKQNQV